MDLQQQLHERIDALWQKGTLAYAEVLREIDALPAFAPVEPKEWPDAEGVWVIDGDPNDAVIAMGGVDCCGDLVLVDRYGTVCYKTIAGCQDAQRPMDNRRRTCLAVRGFRRAALIVPPAKPAEPKLTQEAWAVYDDAGNPVCFKDCESRADTYRLYADKHCAFGGPHTVVRIPPLPMETER